MDKKDLYMTIGELLRVYSAQDIDNCLDHITKLYIAESNMGKITKLKGEKNATSKKKGNC